MPGIAIWQDIPVGELRRQARLEEDGRVAARLGGMDRQGTVHLLTAGQSEGGGRQASADYAASGAPATSAWTSTSGTKPS